MKKRLISAFVALVISVPIIIQGGMLFYIYAIFLSLIGLREVMNLIVKDDFIIVFNYFIFLMIMGLNLFKNNFDFDINFNVIFHLYFLLMLLKYKKYDISKMFYLMGITLFLSLSFSCIIITRNIGLNYLLYVLILPFMNDTFAHLIGSKIGRHKINDISPNKSWEGALAGFVFGTLISTIFYLKFIDANISLVLIIGINMLLSIIGQFGDLFFSLIKRKYKIKDFSNLMPGHGGVLDRLDSVIFVALAFSYLITII